jgi:hypothetical protein
MSGLELLIQLVKCAIRLFIRTATLVHRYISAALLGALCMFGRYVLSKYTGFSLRIAGLKLQNLLPVGAYDALIGEASPDSFDRESRVASNQIGVHRWTTRLARPVPGRRPWLPA